MPMQTGYVLSVGDGIVINVTTGDRCMACATPGNASQGVPLRDVAARHGLDADGNGTAIVARSMGAHGGVSISIPAPDVPRGDAKVRFYGDDGKELCELDVHNGLRIVDNASTCSPRRHNRITFYASSHSSWNGRWHPMRAEVYRNAVTLREAGMTVFGDPEEDYAADLLGALLRIYGALDEDDARFHVAISSFLCGVQQQQTIDAVDWLYGCEAGTERFDG